LFPIKNGKQINLKTLEISERTKESYFDYEAPVNFTTETKNADDFFKKLMPKQEHREYLRKVLASFLSCLMLFNM
jgi:hypothetical protein